MLTREASGGMIVEGYRECWRALDNGYKARAIFHCPDLYFKNENEPVLVDVCAKLGAEVFTCSKVCFEKIAYKDRPNGLLMIGPHVSIKLADLKLPENALVIVTEAIGKPDNLGTILRSATATILVYEGVRQCIAKGVDKVPAFIPWHGEGKIDH